MNTHKTRTIMTFPELNETTRRYPRTLQEAFKRDEGYADTLHVFPSARLRLSALEWQAVFAMACLAVGFYFM